MVYRFIDNNKEDFGVRWLLRRFSLSANAYYNYLKTTELIKRRLKILSVQYTMKLMEYLDIGL